MILVFFSLIAYLFVLAFANRRFSARVGLKHLTHCASQQTKNKSDNVVKSFIITNFLSDSCQDEANQFYTLIAPDMQFKACLYCANIFVQHLVCPKM